MHTFFLIVLGGSREEERDAEMLSGGWISWACVLGVRMVRLGCAKKLGRRVGGMAVLG